jgi:hypothetical protein
MPSPSCIPAASRARCSHGRERLPNVLPQLLVSNRELATIVSLSLGKDLCGPLPAEFDAFGDRRDLGGHGTRVKSGDRRQ